MITSTSTENFHSASFPSFCALPNHNNANDVFPAKLYRLLEETTKNGYDDVISWSPDGMSFKVYDTERFATEIMPSYFGSNKYRSFQKNLNMWAFKYTERRGKSYHPLFRRGLPHLICRMQRQLVKHQIERQQNKRDLRTKDAAEIVLPKQMRNNETMYDLGSHALNSSNYDYNNGASATRDAASSIIDMNKSKNEEQEQHSTIRPSPPPPFLLADINKKTIEISPPQQQKRWFHRNQNFQAGGSLIKDDTIELPVRRPSYYATEDSGVCHKGNDIVEIIASLLSSTSTNCPSGARRPKGTADSFPVFCGNLCEGIELPSFPSPFYSTSSAVANLNHPNRCSVNNNSSGNTLDGGLGLHAALAANLVVGSKGSVPSKIRDSFNRNVLQAYIDQGANTTRLEINNHCTATTPRPDVLNAQQLHQENEQLRSLLSAAMLLPKEYQSGCITSSYGSPSYSSVSSFPLPSYDFLLQYLSRSNHQETESLTRGSTNNNFSAIAQRAGGNNASGAAPVNKLGELTRIANFIAANKKRSFVRL